MTVKSFNSAAATPQERGLALLEETGRLPPDLWKVNDLIINGADLEQKDDDSMTPLLRATKLNSTGAAFLLIHHGADVCAADKTGDTALMYAERHHNLEIIKLLQDCRAPSRGMGGGMTGEMWDRHMESLREQALAEEAKETTITVFKPLTLKPAG
ncbi:MAG: ankyrin repeat domain-containing protein [Alphaproteobacteria bacterium]|nr:MAG: ankyrin repeat domain-containing protein [Alphaproteobacteria bacterium]